MSPTFSSPGKEAQRCRFDPSKTSCRRKSTETTKQVVLTATSKWKSSGFSKTARGSQSLSKLLWGHPQSSGAVSGGLLLQFASDFENLLALMRFLGKCAQSVDRWWSKNLGGFDCPGLSQALISKSSGYCSCPGSRKRSLTVTIDQFSPSGANAGRLRVRLARTLRQCDCFGIVPLLRGTSHEYSSHV